MNRPVFKFRNYDPDSGTARKHARVDEEDTVEKQVEGMAERVIAEDAIKRAEELVSFIVLFLFFLVYFHV